MEMHSDVRQIIADQRAARARLRNPSRVVVDSGISVQKPAAGIKSGDVAKAASPAPRLPRPRWKHAPLPKDHPAKILFDAFGVRGLSIVKIVRVVANYFRLPPIEIFAERREKRIVIPRHIVMYLAKTLTTASLPAIGRALNRDHTTAMYGVRKITAMRAVDAELDQKITEIERVLSA